MIYCLVFLFCCLFIVLENARQNIDIFVKCGQVALTVFLILFIGFRLVGVDYEIYEAMYKNSEDIESTMEPFFLYIMKFFYNKYWAFSTFTCIIAAFSVLLKMYTIKKYSPFFS
jgi:glucan phosphoethanolaminetransferase (alkaline phosphatase superfamily)